MLYAVPLEAFMFGISFKNTLIAATLMSGICTATQMADAKGKKAKPAAAAAAASPGGAAKAPAKKSVLVTAEHKKTLAGLFAGYKFGMTKAEVLAGLTKVVEESFTEKIQATTDVMAQDRLRREKKAEMTRISDTFVEFKGKKTGWDVSLIENEFAHNTNESMMVHWENNDGKNQRRFFFFSDGKLYKMFISLDTSILPADKRNFETFQAAMTSKYGPGDVDGGKITWNAGEFSAVAYDKLNSYDALCLVIVDNAENRALAELRSSKAVAKAGPSAITKAVLDDGKDKIDINANQNAIDSVLKDK
jgi:hypothetical protein